VDSSVYCLPADLLGEGAERVAAQLRDRAGGPGLTVAACYHASRDILPHNPAYRVASMAPGAFYHVGPSACAGPLRPAPSPSADGRDIFDPGHLAVRAEMGVAPHHLAQAGVHLEEPVYLTDPADADTAIAWYRTQLGPAAPLSVVLRPGPPDTLTPATLRRKAAAAQAHNCTELNFYAYGLYRLQALDRIRHALSAS
jgi:hypothetical protein